MSKYWLAVASAEHVNYGIGLGIAQTNRGKPQGISLMSPGDGLVFFYSPKTSYPDGEPLKAFTAVGRVADGEPWQADEAGFKPWRRKVDYDDGAPVPLSDLDQKLELTRPPN